MAAKKVTIVEMGLRDGLQNEKVILSTEVRLEILKRLLDIGARRIEVGAFVSPQWVPQMAGSMEVTQAALQMQKEKKTPKGTEFSVLVPNEKGMLMAIETGIKEVAIFAAASESFSKKNINCTIEESFERFKQVMAFARKHKIKVRGYLSTCFGCPFEGKVSETKVIQLAKRLHQLGCYEISIGDTIGVADPAQVERVFKKLKKAVPVKKLAAHFHDTRGQALANILVAYNLGVQVFDSSIGGLGGCPYAPGAAGNVATEDVVYMFQGMG
ncbi:MAG: hydroxymethylglutaryl-CoA lyase, partial [Pseudobdellovibrionaceae bacterium]